MTSKHTFSVISFIRQNRKNKKGEVSIYLRITVDGVRTEVVTKQFVELEKWNSEKGRVKGNGENPRTINNCLDSFEKRVRSIYTDLLEKNRLVTAVAIKRALLGTEEKKNTLLILFDDYTKEVGSKVGRGFSSGTYQNYLSTKKHLSNFIPTLKFDNDIPLKELSYNFIERFEAYLKLKCNNSHNGSIKHIERLKKVVNIAVKRELIEKYPFSSYKITKEKTNRDFLTEDELERFENAKFESVRLSTVQDVFIFVCYTGLSYSDIVDLTKDNIGIGIDGGKWIFTERNKTDERSNIPLLPPALRILEKYKNHPEVINNKSLLPLISNQKFNKYLKEIATSLDIKKDISFHIGRHTFATTVTLCNDIPIETVSKMLGHSSLRTTQIYAKVIEKKVSHDMGKLKEKLQNKEKQYQENLQKDLSS